jgi:hypothetical protein
VGGREGGSIVRAYKYGRASDSDNSRMSRTRPADGARGGFAVGLSDPGAHRSSGKLATAVA